MMPGEDEITARAHLLPEEESAGGSADPRAQAAAILRESEERVNAPSYAPTDASGPEREDVEVHEHRRSEDVTDTDG
ncbi:hypothetical protein [Umezawaea beigongshangensis]|uniref:hypothetical protein n=1 Tax=Umezawaea beigongshangensis TaxID=2780383 RepID=UPI0018F26C46|nr:hypothetical protein [Umezawaea beigongshangensis]